MAHVNFPIFLDEHGTILSKKELLNYDRKNRCLSLDNGNKIIATRSGDIRLRLLLLSLAMEEK